RHREYVPDQRTTKLRLDSHGARIRKKPVGVPRTAQVQQWEQARAGDGKQSHGFRETIDRLPPLLPQQQQNSRNQGSRVANADPPNEIDNREAPRDWNIDSPDADAHRQQVGNPKQQDQNQNERESEPHVPEPRRSMREYDGADLVGYRSKRVTGLD